MAVRIRVGPVEVRTETDLTPKQIRRLLIDTTALAALADLVGPPPKSSADDRPPVGFAAHVERSPETDDW